MGSCMNALFMVPTLAGYMHGCIEAFVETVPGAEATVLAQANASHTPFEFPPHPRIRILDVDALSRSDLDGLIAERPDIAYVGGWIDARYRRIAAALRRHVPVALGMDNRWNGTLKQRFMVTCLGPWVRSLCTHMWIPGLSQYEYARRLGFSRHRILTGLYSANTGLYRPSPVPPAARSPKTLLFIGAMWEAKGVNELVAAFRNVAAAFPEWRLQLVGDGPLVDVYRGKHDRIDVTGFRQQHELVDLLAGASAFCLPSHYDQWAVVIHEACCAGLPVVATDACGAVTAFVHDGYNGFQCRARDVRSLTQALQALMSLPNETLNAFGRRSHELSRQITRELWVSKLVGLARLRG
jgi:glycosyltransferase involved in cell wall biosynthesis